MSAHDSLHVETLRINEQLAHLGEQCLNKFRLDLRIITLLPSGGKRVLGISEVQPHARTVDRSSWLAINPKTGFRNASLES
jgi:hypothetical protein